MNHKIDVGDCVQWAKDYAQLIAEGKGEKFHALLCDPPYHLSGGFMGKNWDKGGVSFSVDTWLAFKEVMHDGAFGMAFASSRGWHRLAVAIEDAGFVLHPTIFGWCVGQGFPKATRIDTQIQKRDDWNDVGLRTDGRGMSHTKLDNHEVGSTGVGHADGSKQVYMEKEPTNPLAIAWQGHRYGRQALKPAIEPIIVFQKPYSGRPIENIVDTGAGALWIDGGRISHHGNIEKHSTPSKSGLGNKVVYGKSTREQGADSDTRYHATGRWPSNFILHHCNECYQVTCPKCDGSGQNPERIEFYQSRDGRAGAHIPECKRCAGSGVVWNCLESCPVRRLGEQSGVSKSSKNKVSDKRNYGKNPIYNESFDGERNPKNSHSDKGTASRFFYQVQQNIDESDPVFYCAKASRRERDSEGGRNPHPTVKPLKLTKYLSTLLLPPPNYNRRLFIPFSGVGSEMIGAQMAGWDFVQGVELSSEYKEIAEDRIKYYQGVDLDDLKKPVKKKKSKKKSNQMKLI